MISICRPGTSAPTTFLALVFGLIPACCTAQAPSAAPRYEAWKLVAQSDLILKAELDAPVEEIRASIGSKRYSYVTLRVKSIEALKGTPNSPDVQVRYFTKPTPYNPSPQGIIDLNGREVLLFLIRVDDPVVAGLYFAGHTPKALQAIDPAILTTIRQEVENQRRIAAAYRGSKVALPDSHHQKVQALIGQMLDGRTEEAAFRKLEQLGQAAVPSMIRLMDDRRPLPIPQISLENKSPNAFEGIRHYGPEVVVDAIAALLNQITRENFGFIYNGGSERERAKTIEGWRIYLYYQHGKSA